jgi:hypothetical protein
MRGVVFLGERELELKEFPDPAPGPGEVVIEMKASGHVWQRPARLSRSAIGRLAWARRSGSEGRADR